jgi:hypothetical protein
MDLHVYDINHLLLPLGEAWKVTKSNVHDHQSFLECVEEPAWVDNGFKESSFPSFDRSTQAHKYTIVIGAQMVQNIALNHIRHVSDGAKLGRVIVAGT